MRRALTWTRLSFNFIRVSHLPFLYHTRALEYEFNSAVHHITAPTIQKRQRNFRSTSKYRANPRNSQSKDPIPFEASPGSIDTETSQSYDSERERPSANQKPGVQGSTLTAKERAVFDRIFKDISQLESAESTEERSDFELEEDGNERQARNIEEILEDAIRNSKDKISKESELETRVKLLQSSWRVPEVQSWNENPKIPDVTTKIKSFRTDPFQNDDIYETARQEHKAHFMASLDKAQTDIQVWKVLQAEVFSLNPERKLKKDAVAALDSRTEHAALQPALTQSIFQQNYGFYCLEAQRLLRREFPTSPYAVQVLPTIKYFGPDSYVLGASPSLCNEMICLKWTRYTDLHGIADLLQEMRNQVVEANEVTLEILNAISRERQVSLKAITAGKLRPANGRHANSEVTEAWWTLRAVQEAWYKIIPLHDKIKKEQAQRLIELNAEGGV